MNKMQLKQCPLTNTESLALQRQATNLGESEGNLVRILTDEYLSSPKEPKEDMFIKPRSEGATTLLHPMRDYSFYLTDTQVYSLSALADKFHTVEKELLRFIVIKGLNLLYFKSTKE